MRTVFILDGTRCESECYEMNGITRDDNDIVVVSRSAISASIALVQLAAKNIPIDIIMLGDGDTPWFTSWLMVDHNLSFVRDIIKNASWHIHTSGDTTCIEQNIARLKGLLDNPNSDVLQCDF